VHDEAQTITAAILDEAHSIPVDLYDEVAHMEGVHLLQRIEPLTCYEGMVVWSMQAANNGVMAVTLPDATQTCWRCDKAQTDVSLCPLF
jgi:hypothetical protein